MPYLLSDSKMRQLDALLDARPTGGAVSQSRTVQRAGAPLLPFDMYFLPASNVFRVYLPAGCFAYDDAPLAVDEDAMTPVTQFPGWYEFTPPSSPPDDIAKVFAVAFPSSSSERKLRVIVDTGATALLKSLRFCNAAHLIAIATRHTAGRWSLETHHAGSITLQSPPPFGADRYLWGIKIRNADLTVGAGAALRRAGVVHLLDSGETTITIASDEQWVGWEYDPSTNALAVIGPEDDMPADGDGKVRGPLYQVKLEDDDGDYYITSVTIWQHGVVAVSLFG